MSVEGVVLAAGPSRRFAESAAPGQPRLKQLLDFGGETLVRRTARTALRSKLRRVIVVIGCDGEAVRAEVEDLAVAIVDNPEWDDGQSRSVRAGVAAIGAQADGALFVPCDQPFLDVATIDRVISVRTTTGASIVRPVFAGRPGAPVLFGRELFPELASLEGDDGGRQLFGAHADLLRDVELDTPWPLADVDSWSDYETLRARLEA